MRTSCGSCHKLDEKMRMSRISYRRTTPEGWEETIKRMVSLDSVHLEPAAARQILDQAGLSASNSDEIPNGMLSSGDYTALCDTRVFPAAVPRMWFWDTPSIQYQAYNPAQRYRAERWDKYDGP